MGGRSEKAQRRVAEYWREHTFFVDSCLGADIIPGILRSHGVRVETHREHFAEETPDEAWIAHCGDKGWVGLTNDRLKGQPLQRELLRAASARVLLIGGKSARDGASRGHLFVAALPAIGRFLKANLAPFLARIGAGPTVELRWPSQPVTKRALYAENARAERAERDGS